VPAPVLDRIGRRSGRLEGVLGLQLRRPPPLTLLLPEVVVVVVLLLVARLSEGWLRPTSGPPYPSGPHLDSLCAIFRMLKGAIFWAKKKKSSVDW
jgi:hypothetical protein